jgi:hypothetical protein
MPRLSENAISFFGAGGHKHDGVSSTLISTDKYSLFDFNPGYRGSQSRITIQQANQAALEEWVMNLVNTKVLAPAGLDLAPGLLSGKSIRANTITATELQANTITADEIAANAVTANELAANLVLVNNVIRSNNYNGTIAANGAITANGNAGWAITSFGSAEFANAVIRGNVTANAGSIGGWNVDSDSLYSGTKSSNGNYATSGITIGSSGFISAKEFRLDADGNAYFKGDLNGANIVGVTGRFTGSVTVNGDLTAGGTTIYANGQITNGGYTLSATGVLTATGANITGVVNATSGTIGDWLIGDSLYAEASASFPGNSGLTIDLSPTDGIYAQRWQGSYVGAGYFTEVRILNGSSNTGITVRGTANGDDLTSSMTSSVIYAGLYHESATNFWAGSGYGIKGRGTYTYLGGDSDSISTGTMRVVNATALYNDPSTTNTNKLVCITSSGTLQVYGGVANTYATSGHSHSYSDITSKPSLMPLGGATVSSFSLQTSQADEATGIMFESQRSGGGIALSTRANGFVSCSQFPGLATGGSAVLRLDGFLYFRSSTRAIKENIEYFDETPSIAATNILKKLRPVKFTVKRNERDTDYTYALRQLSVEAGFIIEDIEEVQDQIDVSLLSYEATDPGKFDLVDRTPFSLEEDFEDIKPTMYKENAIMSIAVRAIQELTARVEELENSRQEPEGV